MKILSSKVSQSIRLDQVGIRLLNKMLHFKTIYRKYNYDYLNKFRLNFVENN